MEPEQPLTNIDEDSKVHQCHLCDYKTAFRASLLNHQIVHSDARPWICKICSYAAKRKYDLKKHLKVKHSLSEDVDGLPQYMLECVDNENRMQLPVLDDGRHMSNSYDSVRNSAATLMSTSTLVGKDLTPSLSSPESAIITFKPSVTSSSQIQLPHFHLSSNLLPSKMPQKIKDEDDDSSEDVVCVSEVKQSVPVNNRQAAPIRGSSVQNSGFQLASPQLWNVNSNWSVPRPNVFFTKFQNSESTQGVGRNSYAALNPVWCGHDDNNVNITVHRNEDSVGAPKKQKVLDLDSGELGFSRSAADPVLLAAERCSSVGSDAGSQTGIITSSVMRNKCCETRRAFHCVHCDIMFFDNAMYLMHTGLHGADNPWVCAVCKKSFGEKYSFTSHFINEHS